MQFIAVFNASPTISKIPFCGDDGMKELKRLLDLIEKRPQLFIGNDGIWALKHFIDGYCVCLREHGIDVNLQMQEFDTFVFNKFNLKRSSLSLWCLR